MKYYIIAGEASGDMHAAAVVRALQKRGTHCQLYGLGGPQLERLGMELIVDCRDIAVVGIVEVTSSTLCHIMGHYPRLC